MHVVSVSRGKALANTNVCVCSNVYTHESTCDKDELILELVTQGQQILKEIINPGRIF